MKQYKAILFDLDGTLLDTSEGVISSVQYTIDTLGYKKLDVGQMRSFIGPPSPFLYFDSWLNFVPFSFHSFQFYIIT